MDEDKYPFETALQAVREAVESLNDPIGHAPVQAQKPRITVADLGAAPSADIDDLTKASDDLKRRIDEARKRSDMPIDPQLGSPDFQQKAADGRFDLPDEDDE